jgi:DNA polymerase family A
VRVAVVAGPGQSGLLCELTDDGKRAGPVERVADLAQVIARYETVHQPRWVWPATVSLYPDLVRAGVRVARCHDVALAETLLAAREAANPAHRSPSPEVELAKQRLRTLPAQRPMTNEVAQQTLFEPTAAEQARDPAELAAAIDALIEVHVDQLGAAAADDHPTRFGLLMAAESAGALAAAEMTEAGLPWRPDVHDALLTELLGARPPGGLGSRSGVMQPARPPKLAELATQISAAFGERRQVNPDSPSQVLKALAADGIRLDSTRLAVLRTAEHPAIPALLEYKELSRLHSAFGWSWLDTWVRDGRFRPEYVVGGVVSGRWASRGGGALQIPRMLRRAVIADPGWTLVVADAAQLEPRVLAALAGDRAFAAAAAAGDLYTELAGAFGGDRAKAKIAMLSAMYGGAGGEAGQLLAVLRQRFPAAAGYVEAAARAGEEGRVVRSVLGRTCPPPSARWRELTEEASDPDGQRDPSAGSASRARGRFTRNFVVQASAADWATVMLANLRAGLTKITSRNDSPDNSPVDQPTASAAGQSRPGDPHLVFFQHDEVIVHCPVELADAVVAATAAAAADAARQVFGQTRVAFPLTTAVVDCYADAK